MFHDAESRQSSGEGNLLLSDLSERDYRGLSALGTRINLPTKTVLFEPGQKIRHVFFPIRGSVSLTTPVAGHPRVAVGMIGDEGMLGIWSLLGVGIAPLHAEILSDAAAWRFDVAPFLKSMTRYPTLRRRLNLYLYVLFTQRTQAAICAGFHVLEGRLANRILMTRDRAHADDFHITHEFLAGILGVRRAGVTREAQLLQERGLIRYSRGNVEIIDGRGLEAAACDCYVKDLGTYRRALD
ncbi:MAG: Crp/Fnr family transcriptional regulator [Steroidobacteraceae bacterium]